MDVPVFSDSQFLDHNVLNAAAGLPYSSAQQMLNLTNTPGLLNTSSLVITTAAMNMTVFATAPFGVLFGSGSLSEAFGVTNGLTSSTYTVNLSSLVPGSGSATVYVVASYFQINESPYTVTGPAPGHPDFNPSFAAYQSYSDARDSIAITATLFPPDNYTTFELCRTTLVSGQTSITAFDTTHWVYASSVLAPTGVTPGTYLGATVTVGADGRVTAISGPGRIILSANLDLYVSAASGSDSTGNGSAGAPWATLQFAWNTLVSSYDLAGFVVTVHCSGHFTTGFSTNCRLTGQASINSVVFDGGSSATITATNGYCFASTGGGYVTQNWSTCSSPGSIYHSGPAIITAWQGGEISFSNIIFGASGYYHITAGTGSAINCTGGYTIAGSTTMHWYAYGGATIACAFETIVITGTPAITYFAVAADCGAVICYGNTFLPSSAAVTGTRFWSTNNGSIDTNGAGATYLPGNVVGILFNGGVIN